ncbi:MAG TPA: alpha/beta hydrolase [Bacillales bacterium]|nr:alpha/beta hydrolase [Bacillales bacterium]
MWKWEADDARGVFVLVHGSSEHHGRYEWLIEKWRSEGFHVVMGDLPGHGNTKNRGHIDSFDEYIETVADWVAEAETYSLPIFLFGHSLGGLVVIRTLMEKSLPVRGVILSSPCTGLVHPPPKPLKMAAKIADGALPKLKVRLKSSSENPNATRNTERLKKDSEDSLMVKKVSIRWYNELEKAMKLVFESEGKFPDVPLLVMQAGDDKIVDKHAVRRWFNRLSVTERAYKEWDGLYHEIFNEPERDAVFRHALGFMELQLRQFQQSEEV